MKKVFLDYLPRYMERRYKGKFNWKSSIGYKVPFVYDDIKGEVEIVDYDRVKHMLTFIYLEEMYKITTDGFISCRFGYLLNKITKDFKIPIGRVFKEENRDLIITDREYRFKEQKPDKKGRIYTAKQKYYKYTCNKCGWTEGWIVENNLLKGVGCSCCANRTAVLGINTIWDTDRWMVGLGVSEKDAKKHTRCSNKKIEVICLDCRGKKKMTISHIYQQKSICCSCGDGCRYPEKFMTSVLNQLNIEFETQLSKTTSNWCKSYRYDFYISKYNMIIETHGEQHYKEQSKTSKFKKTLKEEQENDKLKKQLALENGINTYIEIDCRISDLEWIKNNILNSELANIVDLSNIDWLKCEEFALSNLVKQVCEYWNQKEEWETTRTIAENNEWGIKGISTIRKYLKIGVKHKWCEYNPKDSESITYKQVEIFKDGVSLGGFKSISELSRQSKELLGVELFRGNISDVCRGKLKQLKGFNFAYITNKKEEQK